MLLVPDRPEVETSSNSDTPFPITLERGRDTFRQEQNWKVETTGPLHHFHLTVDTMVRHNEYHLYWVNNLTKIRCPNIYLNLWTTFWYRNPKGLTVWEPWPYRVYPGDLWNQQMFCIIEGTPYPEDSVLPGIWETSRRTDKRGLDGEPQGLSSGTCRTPDDISGGVSSLRTSIGGPVPPRTVKQTLIWGSSSLDVTRTLSHKTTWLPPGTICTLSTLPSKREVWTTPAALYNRRAVQRSVYDQTEKFVFKRPSTKRQWPSISLG